MRARERQRKRKHKGKNFIILSNEFALIKYSRPIISNFVHFLISFHIVNFLLSSTRVFSHSSSRYITFYIYIHESDAAISYKWNRMKRVKIGVEKHKFDIFQHAKFETNTKTDEFKWWLWKTELRKCVIIKAYCILYQIIMIMTVMDTIKNINVGTYLCQNIYMNALPNTLRLESSIAMRAVER